jgi:hypothetical protein
VVELGAVLQNSRMHLLSSALSCIGSAEPGDAQATNGHAGRFNPIADSLDSSSGGFGVRPRNVVDHERINGTSFVFSAALLALLAVSASEGINILWNTPSIVSTLQETVRAIASRPLRSLHATIIHMHLLSAALSAASGSAKPAYSASLRRVIHHRSTSWASSAC